MNKKVIIGVCAGAVLLLVVAGVVSTMVTNTYANVERERNQIVNQLEAEITGIEESNQVLLQESIGINTERKIIDDEIATEFMSRVLTWDNGDEYDTMRAQIIDEYGLDETSSFVTVFLPQNVSTLDENDEPLSYIDFYKMNSTFVDSTSYLTGVSTSAHSYIALVEAESSVDTEREVTGSDIAVGSTLSIFTYDVTNDGQLINIKAYATTQN